MSLCGWADYNLNQRTDCNGRLYPGFCYFQGISVLTGALRDLIRREAALKGIDVKPMMPD